MKKVIALLIVSALIFTLGCTQQQTQQQGGYQGGYQMGYNNSTGGQGYQMGMGAGAGSAVAGQQGCMMDGMPCSVITPAELAAHNSASDCWVAFQGKVYDITSFVPKHPGGPGKLIPLCGTSSEFEAAFTVQHGMSKVAVLESQGTLEGSFSG